MSERPLNYLKFFAALILLLGVLKAVNWLPSVIQKENLREYESINEVRSALNIKDIYLPSYFPQSYQWPPHRILAQGKPHLSIVMEFRDINSDDISLIIFQTDSDDLPEKSLNIPHVTERVDYILKDRKAALLVGMCKGDVECSMLSWKENGYLLGVRLKARPFELIRIAESMIP